jgi:hypothetical protein
MFLLVKVSSGIGHSEAPGTFLILGGSKNRELECAKLLKDVLSSRSGGHIILSSGSTNQLELAAAANIVPQLVHIDRRAVDTLTNFTSLVKDLRRSGCKSVAIVTSQSHMKRAYPIALIVFGSYGISTVKMECSDIYGKRVESRHSICIHMCVFLSINKIHKYSQRLSLKPQNTHTHTHTHAQTHITH